MTKEEASRRITEIGQKRQATERFLTSVSIQNDIKRMRCKYREFYHRNPNRILLDAKAESRLTAFVVRELISQDENKEVDEILVNGIRKMSIKMYGMEVLFDCDDFCVEYW